MSRTAYRFDGDGSDYRDSPFKKAIPLAAETDAIYLITEEGGMECRWFPDLYIKGSTGEKPISCGFAIKLTRAEVDSMSADELGIHLRNRFNAMLEDSMQEGDDTCQVDT